MKLTFGKLTLRDMEPSDVEDEIRWTNVDTAWFYQDTPWMKLEPVNPDELRADMAEVVASLPEQPIRWRFELDVDGRHIGRISSYYLNEHLAPMPWEAIDQSKNAEENHAIRGLGIEICEMDCWGQGIGARALNAAMSYYRGLGEGRFLLETWSGHARMLGCARKLGFREVHRQRGDCAVDGKAFDWVVLEKEVPPDDGAEKARMSYPIHSNNKP